MMSFRQRIHVRGLGLGIVAAIAALALSATVALAAPTLHGTFTTPNTQGSISYTAVRAFHGGSEGHVVVAGKRHRGSMYAATGGGVGLVWSYGVTGNTAGNALVTLQPDGTYSGPIWFYNRAGRLIDSGTVVVTFP